MPANSNKGSIDMKKKEIRKMIKEIESLNVVVLNYALHNHIKLMVENRKTKTTRMIVVSNTPKCQGKYSLVKSSVRKAFRKIGEDV